MSRRTYLTSLLIVSALAASPARAQVPYPRDLIPTRSALARAGLEQQWLAVVPLTADERLGSISLNDGLLFAQTNRGYFHTYDAETGRLLWTARLGNQVARVRPASVNSFAVFVTNFNRLFALDRRTGLTIWTQELRSLPSSPTSCDEERVFVGLNDGKVYGYNLKVKDAKGVATRISDVPIEQWNWQTGGSVTTKPLPALKLVVLGSDDGKVYVSLADERLMVYRIATEGAIGAGFGSYGTRLLLVPSADRNLYGVDLLTSRIRWTFPSGAPIRQEPMVADTDIFVVNDAGQLSSIDAETGSPRWSVSTHGGRLLSIGAKRVYLESSDDDLFIIDRASGQTVADAEATLNRYGLKIRPFELGVTNRETDRLYFATTSGMIVTIREIGLTRPRFLRDPKSPPFGTIPIEGLIKELVTPESQLSPGEETVPARPAAPPAEATPPADGEKPEPAAPAVETPPAPDKPK